MDTEHKLQQQSAMLAQVQRWLDERPSRALALAGFLEAEVNRERAEEAKQARLKKLREARLLQTPYQMKGLSVCLGTLIKRACSAGLWSQEDLNLLLDCCRDDDGDISDSSNEGLTGNWKGKNVIYFTADPSSESDDGIICYRFTRRQDSPADFEYWEVDIDSASSRTDDEHVDGTWFALVPAA